MSGRAYVSCPECRMPQFHGQGCNHAEWCGRHTCKGAPPSHYRSLPSQGAAHGAAAGAGPCAGGAA